MPASLLFVVLWSAITAAACAEEQPVGPLDLGDLGPPDLGSGDAQPRDGGLDASHDAAPTDARVDADMGRRDMGPVDFGRPCDYFDSGGVDLGPLYDMGPFVAPDLDAASIDYGVEPPGTLHGCPELAWCTAYPTRDAGLTWDTWAQEFFATYCTRCHSSTLAIDDAGTRHGAPGGYDWDVKARVYMHLYEIRTSAGVANAMPADNPSLLPCERRRELVTWIDEGAP